MKNVTEFANRVREFRRARKLTQEELAEKLGVTRNYLSMIEGGREPSAMLMELFGHLENSATSRVSTEDKTAGGTAGRLEECAVNYHVAGEGQAGDAEVEDVVDEGGRSMLDHLVEKLDDDQVADEVCCILKKKKRGRFEMARYLIKELERRERNGKGTNGH